MALTLTCDNCGCRTDIIHICHTPECKYEQKCNDCGRRMDMSSTTHALTCKRAPACGMCGHRLNTADVKIFGRKQIARCKNCKCTITPVDI